MYNEVDKLILEATSDYNDGFVKQGMLKELNDIHDRIEIILDESKFGSGVGIIKNGG
jgi:hypothetical protein